MGDSDQAEKLEKLRQIIGERSDFLGLMGTPPKDIEEYENAETDSCKSESSSSSSCSKENTVVGEKISLPQTENAREEEPKRTPMEMKLPNSSIIEVELQLLKEDPNIPGEEISWEVLKDMELFDKDMTFEEMLEKTQMTGKKMESSKKGGNRGTGELRLFKEVPMPRRSVETYLRYHVRTFPDLYPDLVRRLNGS